MLRTDSGERSAVGALPADLARSLSMATTPNGKGTGKAAGTGAAGVVGSVDQIRVGGVGHYACPPRAARRASARMWRAATI